MHSVELPYAFERKCPDAAFEFRWKYVFPATGISRDPRSGIRRRHHLHESSVSKAIRASARRSDIRKRVTAHTLRQGELVRHLSVYFPSAPDNTCGPYATEILYVDDSIDFALLSVATPLSPLDCADTYAFRRGQEVIIIGNPGAFDGSVLLENAISRGIMSTQAEIGGQKYDQLGMSVNPGNSGGPVLNRSGTVIGMVTLKAVNEEGLAFSIPIQAINESVSAANSMSREAIAETQSLHRARVVYRHAVSLGFLYKLWMARYTDAMTTAINKGLTPQRRIVHGDRPSQRGELAA